MVSRMRPEEFSAFVDALPDEALFDLVVALETRYSRDLGLPVPTLVLRPKDTVRH